MRFLVPMLILFCAAPAADGDLPGTRAVKRMLYKDAVEVRVTELRDQFNPKEENILKIAGGTVLYYGAIAFPAGD